MRKLIFYVFIAALIFLLTACGATVEEKQNSNHTDTITTETMSVLGVGEELKALKVAKGTGYSILYETESGSLEWLDLTFPGYGYFETVKSDRDYSYLVRYKNTKNMMGWVPVFRLYLHIEDELESGVVHESCGENCTKEVENKIID